MWGAAFFVTLPHTALRSMWMNGEVLGNHVVNCPVVRKFSNMPRTFRTRS